MVEPGTLVVPGFFMPDPSFLRQPPRIVGKPATLIFESLYRWTNRHVVKQKKVTKG